jgi:hypothetical protein
MFILKKKPPRQTCLEQRAAGCGLRTGLGLEQCCQLPYRWQAWQGLRRPHRRPLLRGAGGVANRATRTQILCRRSTEIRLKHTKNIYMNASNNQIIFLNVSFCLLYPQKLSKAQMQEFLELIVNILC